MYVARKWLLVGGSSGRPPILIRIKYCFAIIELLLLLLLLLLAKTATAAAAAFLNYYCCRLSVENMSGVKIGSTRTHTHTHVYIH